MPLFNEKKHLIPTGIFKSLKVAFKNLCRPTMTIRYPRVRAIIPERARFAVEIKYATDGTHRCQACRICEGACPDHLIKLDIEQREDKSKYIQHWHYNRGACMMCGLCVESCPFDAIRMGHDYELAHAERELLILDLLSDTPAYQRPKPAPKQNVAETEGGVTARSFAAAPNQEATADNANAARMFEHGIPPSDVADSKDEASDA